jgi:hypothetical protein
MTKIVVGDGFTYGITDEDYLWLGRAAEGEGGDPRATIWTWIQRFAGLQNFRDRFSTLTALVRAHSQPVNPLWAEGGAKCGPGGSHEGTDSCAPSRLVRRARITAMDPADFNSAVKAALGDLRSAQLYNPVPRAVDFAERAVAESFVARTPGSYISVCLGSNCHVITKESESWPDGWVRLTNGGGFSYLWLGAGALLGFVILWRLR